MASEYNEYFQLEGWERTSILIEILHSRLGASYYEDGKLITEDLHPSIYDDKAKELLATASDALMELYQHIGRWGIDNDSQTE